MNWAEPQWLWLLLPVALLGLLLALAARRHRRRVQRLFPGSMFEVVLPRGVRTRRTLRDLLAVGGLGLAVIALAEPRFDKEIRTIEAKGTDLVLLVDLSRSMDARDVDPSRLVRAQREIADLVRVLEGDRIGLVVFAGGAYARMPLTVDYGALLSVVDELRSDTFVAQGSAMAEGILAATELLQRDDELAGRAILILSDGEVHETDGLLEAAEQAAKAGITLYAVGIGEEPARIPDAGGWLTWRGETVITTPDHELLKELARVTGGAFVRSVASPDDITSLYTHEIRRKLQAVNRSADQREVWRSAFQWPLGLALGMLLASAWLGDGRRPWGQAA